MSVMKMVVGLGNPGDEYVDTRHNTGFKVVDWLAEALTTDIKKRKFGARFGLGEFSDKKLILLKPWQFMNRSGQAVATAMGFYKLALSDLLVVTDDLSLDPGRIRIRARGSAGGHNGLGDIVEKLGANEFGRLRIGIGDNGRMDSAVYVLKKPRMEERPALDEAIERARDAVLCWIEHGIDKAMNEFNSEQPDRQ
ncbi:MAG: aminoacyl-tRNA hydrolase [Phycisphaerae bacterium]|nr:aminoacyl-tRNA hydrolase [Phycisphaerae bacterium]